MCDLPDLQDTMAVLSESWQGELCHKGKSIARVCVLGGIKLPVSMPKELEVHQKVKFTEFTTKVVTHTTELNFSQITHVDDHGLMVAVFKPTMESVVMNNFLSFLNKSKSVAVSVIEENNSVVFFIPAKLAPDGMFPALPDSPALSHDNIMFGVFKLGPKYMPIKTEPPDTTNDSVPDDTKSQEADQTNANKSVDSESPSSYKPAVEKSTANKNDLNSSAHGSQSVASHDTQPGAAQGAQTAAHDDQLSSPSNETNGHTLTKTSPVTNQSKVTAKSTPINSAYKASLRKGILKNSPNSYENGTKRKLSLNEYKSRKKVIGSPESAQASSPETDDHEINEQSQSADVLSQNNNTAKHVDDSAVSGDEEMPVLEQQVALPSEQQTAKEQKSKSINTNDKLTIVAEPSKLDASTRQNSDAEVDVQKDNEKYSGDSVNKSNSFQKTQNQKDTGTIKNTTDVVSERVTLADPREKTSTSIINPDASTSRPSVNNDTTNIQNTEQAVAAENTPSVAIKQEKIPEENRPIGNVTEIQPEPMDVKKEDGGNSNQTNAQDKRTDTSEKNTRTKLSVDIQIVSEDGHKHHVSTNATVDPDLPRTPGTPEMDAPQFNHKSPITVAPIEDEGVLPDLPQDDVQIKSEQISLEQDAEIVHQFESVQENIRQNTQNIQSHAQSISVSNVNQFTMTPLIHTATPSIVTQSPAMQPVSSYSIKPPAQTLIAPEKITNYLNRSSAMEVQVNQNQLYPQIQTTNTASTSLSRNDVICDDVITISDDADDSEFDVSIPIRKEVIEFEPTGYYEILANLDTLRTSLAQTTNMAAKDRAKCVQLVDQISEKMVVKRNHRVSFMKNSSSLTAIYKVTNAPLGDIFAQQKQVTKQFTIPAHANQDVNHILPSPVQVQTPDGGAYSFDRNSIDSGIVSSDETINSAATMMPNVPVGNVLISPNQRQPQRVINVGTETMQNVLPQPQVEQTISGQGITHARMVSADGRAYVLQSLPTYVQTSINNEKPYTDTPKDVFVSPNDLAGISVLHAQNQIKNDSVQSGSKDPENMTISSSKISRRSRSSSTDSMSSIFDVSNTKRRSSRSSKRSTSRERRSRSRRSRSRSRDRSRDRGHKGAWLNGRNGYGRNKQWGFKKYGFHSNNRSLNSKDKHDVASRRPRGWKPTVHEIRRFKTTEPKRKRTASSNEKAKPKKKTKRAATPPVPEINVKEVAPEVEAVKKRPLSIAAMLCQLRNDAEKEQQPQEVQKEEDDEEYGKKKRNPGKKERRALKALKKEKKEKKTKGMTKKNKSHKHKRSRSRSRQRSRSGSLHRRQSTDQLDNRGDPMHQTAFRNNTQMQNYGQDMMLDNGALDQGMDALDGLANAHRKGLVYRTEMGSKWDDTDEYEYGPVSAANQNTGAGPEENTRNSLERLMMEYTAEESTHVMSINQPDRLANPSPQRESWRDLGRPFTSPDRSPILVARPPSPPLSPRQLRRSPSPRPIGRPPSPRFRIMGRAPSPKQMGRPPSPIGRPPSPPSPRFGRSPSPRHIGRSVSPRPIGRPTSPRGRTRSPRAYNTPPGYSPPRRALSPIRCYTPPRESMFHERLFSTSSSGSPIRGRYRSPSPKFIARKEETPWRKEAELREREDIIPRRERSVMSPPVKSPTSRDFSSPPAQQITVTSYMFKQWSDAKYLSHLSITVSKMLEERAVAPWFNKIYACQKTIKERMKNQAATSAEARRRLDSARNLGPEEEKQLRDQCANHTENRKRFEMYITMFHFLKTKVEVEELLKRKTKDAQQQDRNRLLKDTCLGLEDKLEHLRKCKNDLLEKTKQKHSYTEKLQVNDAVEQCREMIDDIRNEIQRMRQQTH